MRPKSVQLTALLASVVLVVVAATAFGPINEGRRSMNTFGSESVLQQAPPEYAFAIQAFGAFRGLITDIAFIRAETFKEQGRYYDAMELARWICTLQPHFPAVWEFASWNMAWNISVTTYTPQERWNWVYNGVKLLRDQGIPMNPRALNLYKQLAWTFNNKMGEITDDHHQTYKTNWAWRMHLVLGPPPNPLEDVDPNEFADQITSIEEMDKLFEAARETFEQNEARRRQAAEARGEAFLARDPNEFLTAEEANVVSITPDSAALAQEAAFRQLKRIQQMPDTNSLDALYAAHPETESLVEALRDIGVIIDDRELTEDDYWREEGLAFRFFEPYRYLNEPRTTLAQVSNYDPADDPVAQQAERLDAILDIRGNNPAAQALIRWLQKKVLLDVYRMDTQYMLQVVEEFGPVDWRSVDAQALYWVVRGLVAGGETIHEFRNDKANTARIMMHALRNLFLRGRIIFEPYPPEIHRSYLNLGRDINFIKPMHEAYMKYGPLFDPRGPEYDAVGAGFTYSVGHINHMTEAIQMLYLAGREDEAAFYYRTLRNIYKINAQGEPNPAFDKNLRQFVLDRYTEFIDQPGQRDIRAVINGMLIDALDSLANGEGTQFGQIVRKTRELHDHYMRQNMDTWAKSKRLRPFPDELRDAVIYWFGFYKLPTTSSLSLHRIQLWRALPLYLRQAAYDYLYPQFEAECANYGFDLPRAYPEPAGMDAYREAHPQRRPGDRDDTEDDALDADTLPRTIDT